MSYSLLVQFWILFNVHNYLIVQLGAKDLLNSWIQTNNVQEGEEARKEREERKSHFRRTNEGTDERTDVGRVENKGRVRSAREERAPISQIGFGSRRD